MRGFQPPTFQPVNVNPDDLKQFVCAGCGNDTFMPCLQFKIIPAVLSPTGKLGTVASNVGVCVKCHRPMTQDDIKNQAEPLIVAPGGSS